MINERKFLKQINQKSNKDGDLTYNYVCELLDYNSKQLVNKVSMFDRIISKIIKRKSEIQIIKDNFSLIIDKTHINHLGVLLETLMYYDEFEVVIREEFIQIINRFEKDDDGRASELSFLVDYARKSDENQKSIAENIEVILNNIDVKNFFNIAQMVKGLSDESDDILNKYYSKNKVEIATWLLIDHGSRIRKTDWLKLNEIMAKSKEREEKQKRNANTLSIIIDELLESEDLKFTDINDVGGGAYSSVYQIGDKILKIGKPRKTYSIPNHRRILQPLIRINLDDGNNTDIAHIEISESVETKLENSELTTKTLYEIYKELRQSGIIWTDAKYSNIGRLKRKNYPYLNKEAVESDAKFRGFDKSINEDILDKGELVVIDIDFIYKEGDPNIVWTANSFSREFEKRYQQEIKDDKERRLNTLTLLEGIDKAVENNNANTNSSER